jgi:site-specific DNA-cytosine methylase
MNIELFGCSGGMAEGFRRAGVVFDVVVDADPDACESYETNLGHRPLQMDVRDLIRLTDHFASKASVELIVADPPCTPWSRAGKREGLNDARDMLAETVQLLDELRPVAWLIGNVPGLDDANNWRSVVQPVIGGFASRAGYCVDYAKLDAADFGVPQHRVRPFWYGHRMGTPCIRWPAPTHGDWSTMRLDGLEPWVTCRDALKHLSGDELGKRVRLRRRSCNTDQHGIVLGRPARVVGTSNLSDGNVLLNGAHPPSEINKPSKVISSSQPGNGGALLVHPRHPVSDVDEPARTITAGDGGGSKGARTLAVRPDHRTDPNRPGRVVTTKQDDGRILEWPWGRPSTTVTTREAIPPPGHHPESGSILTMTNAVKLSEKAAAILQGFPEGWHFAGRTKKARWSQIGQAMPPALAAAVAGAIIEQLARARASQSPPARGK